jgi:hypothetical protein
MGIHCADYTTPSTRKQLELTSPTSGGSSGGIVRLQAKSHGVLIPQQYKTNRKIIVLYILIIRVLKISELNIII